MQPKKHKIVVLDGYVLNPGDNPWDEIECLGDFEVYDRTPPDQIVKRIDKADIVITNKTPLFREVLKKLPDLRYIGVLATGYNVVDIDYAKKRGIPVTNIPEYGTKAVAQFVCAMILELCHNIGEHVEAVKSGQWLQSPDFCFWNSPQIELDGKTMGIIGFGRIGRAVGELMHAFGMKVLAYDPNKGSEPTYQPFSWVQLREIFRKSDVISLNCMLTDENEKFVDKSLLGLMKKEAFVINAARGGLVHEQDLADALNAGRIAGAAVDVASTEPIEGDNPLLNANNCLITPHIAWATLGARERLMHQATQNLKAFLSGKPINVVN